MRLRLLIITALLISVNSNTVIMWGSDPSVKDLPSPEVLRSATSIRSTWLCSFAAIVEDDVVTWGTPEAGGDSTTVKHLLTGIQTLNITSKGYSAFSVLQENGRVVSWGLDADSSTVKQLRTHKAKSITSNLIHFSALLNDSTVVSWGNSQIPLNMSTVQSSLVNITNLYSIHFAFAALTSDKRVVTWGRYGDFGSDSSTVQGLLRGVSYVYGVGFSFAALLEDATVVTWGNRLKGGDSSTVKHLLKNINKIVHNERAFAARNTSSDWIVWGDPSAGGNPSQRLLDQIKGSIMIVTSVDSFAALTSTGSVVTWGTGLAQNTNTVQSLLKDVIFIAATHVSYIAITSSHEVITWGDASWDSSDLASIHLPLSTRLPLAYTYCEKAFSMLFEPPVTLTEVIDTVSMVVEDELVYGNSSSSFKLYLVVALVVVFVFVFVVVLCFWKQSKIRKNKSKHSDSFLKCDLITLVPMNTSPSLEEENVLQVGSSTNASLSSLECEIPSDQLTDFVQIGTGFFGKVFRATYVTCCEVVAVKESRKAYDSNFLVEIRMLCNMRQKDIVTFYGWSRSDESIYLVTQYYEQGSLDNFLRFKRVDPEQYALRMVSIARALAYVHGLGLAHMDVATRNILVSKNGLVLGDMGLVTKIGSVVKSKLPIAWCPPEALQSSPIASAAHDVWSFGCTMFEIMGGRSPYSDMVSGDPVVRRKQITKFIKSGILPKKPDNLQKLGEKLWNDIVERCWTGIDERLELREIISLFGNMPAQQVINVEKLLQLAAPESSNRYYDFYHYDSEYEVAM